MNFNNNDEYLYSAFYVEQIFGDYICYDNVHGNILSMTLQLIAVPTNGEAFLAEFSRNI